MRYLLNHHFPIKREKRTTPKGNPLSGVNKFSGWFYRFPKRTDASLANAIIDMNRALSESRSYFEMIQSSGGTIEYFIGWFSEANSGEILDWRILKDCADLRINLAFDVYGQKSPDSSTTIRIGL